MTKFIAISLGRRGSVGGGWEKAMDETVSSGCVWSHWIHESVVACFIESGPVVVVVGTLDPTGANQRCDTRSGWSGSVLILDKGLFHAVQTKTCAV